MRTRRTAEKYRRHSHPFIRVDLPVHGQREPEQAPWLSVSPDGVTGVKVKGEHRSREQEVRKQVASSGASSLQQHRRAVQTSPGFSKLAAHPGAPLGSVRCRLTGATPLPQPWANSAPSGQRLQQRGGGILGLAECAPAVLFIMWHVAAFTMAF